MRRVAVIISMGLLNILLFAIATNVDLYFLVLGAQLILTVALLKNEEITRSEYLLAIIFGIVARALFITKIPMLSFDVNVYSQFAARMVNGKIPYLDFYFPYPLLVAFIFAALYYIYSSPLVFKITFTLIDIVNALVITRVISEPSETKYGYVASAAYLLVPITIIEAAWNGHFEAVVVLFILLALYYFLRGKNWKALIFAGVGSLVKYVPIAVAVGIFRKVKSGKNRFAVLILVGITLAIGYLSMILIGSNVSVLVRGNSSSGPLFYDYSFAAFIQILTGLSGTVGQIGLILIAGLLFVGIVFEKRIPEHIFSKAMKYSILIIFIIIGFGMILYPFSSLYSENYWRRLPEICFAQGLAMLILCSVIVSKWESLSFTEDIELILIALLLLMLIQPVFYAWYVLFLFPVALLFRTTEARVLLIVCLLLYPTTSVGIFSPPPSEQNWFFGSDITPGILNNTVIHYNSTDANSTTVFVKNGILVYRTTSNTTSGYSTRLQWNTSNFVIHPDMIVRIRMVSSADPSFSKPFRLLAVAGLYNATGGEYDERDLCSPISFISNMSWISYYNRINLQNSFTPDYLSLIIEIAANVTGTYTLKIDSFMIENDLNVPSPSWLISIPLSLIGMIGPILIMFPNTFPEFYYELKRLQLRILARLKGANVSLGKGVKLCRGSRVITERNCHLSIGDGTTILTGTEVIAHSKSTITIGSNVFLSRMCTISAHESIEIGDHSSIGAFSFILDTNKAFDDIEMEIRGQGYSCKPISLGTDVWIGAHVVILPGAVIGSHSVVGANSTVRNVFPENSVIAGNPAKVIRERGAR